MEKIKFLKQSGLGRLKETIKDNLDLYRNKTTNWWNVLDDDNYFTVSGIDLNGSFSDLQLVNGGKGDVENCVIIYQLLKNLTPQQATDERVWAYISHFEAWEYCVNRWPLPSLKDGKKDAVKSAINHVKTHFFAIGNRGLIRDNAIARLWWMGFVATRYKGGIQRALKVLLHETDVRANLLERPNLSLSPEIFNAVIRRLEESYDKKVEADGTYKNQKDRGLFDREKFRKLMKKLNRMGGRVALNALTVSQLDDVTRKIIEEIET